LFYRLRRNINYFKFYNQTSRILKTPPIAYKEAPLTIVSMVAAFDVQMYILAMKSLYRRLKRGKILVVADGVDEQARDLIRHHLGPVRFLNIEDIDTGNCPRGGTWERLVHIIRNTSQEYTIQMDADILCVGPIPEVLACIEENRAFTLSDSQGLPKQPLLDWAEEPRQSENIVIAFEKRARDYPNSSELLYIRGSSGFAGFAKEAISIEFLESFHRNGLQLMGERWKEWGTEQLASNFVVANSPNSLVLPVPKYLTFERHDLSKLAEEPSLLHFLGYCRFDQGLFAKHANLEIDALLSGA
jgi:hypothetical protein